MSKSLLRSSEEILLFVLFPHRTWILWQKWDIDLISLHFYNDSGIGNNSVWLYVDKVEKWEVILLCDSFNSPTDIITEQCAAQTARCTLTDAVVLLCSDFHTKTTAKCEPQLQLWQEGNICAECYENLHRPFRLFAWKKKKVEPYQQRNKLITLLFHLVKLKKLHFICATFLQSLKSILRKHLFTCRLRCHVAVSRLAVINVNLSVVGALEHRKHRKAMQISREHLGFGNSLICFAANFDFGAAWFTQVVTWGFHIAVSWVVAGQNRLMKTEETQQLQHRARKASDICLCFIWGLFCLSLLFLERDKKTRVCMVNTVYGCTPYIQHNLSTNYGEKNLTASVKMKSIFSF